MKLFSKKSKTQQTVQTAAGMSATGHPFSALRGYSPGAAVEYDLYSSLREAVPVIDAALSKTVRLIGTFEFESESKRIESILNGFAAHVGVNSSTGLYSFIYCYLDELLTYGTAVGEIIPRADFRGVAALYNASIRDVALRRGSSPLELLVCPKDAPDRPFADQQLILPTLLSPAPGAVYGTPLLRGLPFVSTVLLKIFSSVGTNFERIGNVRYAISYKPGDNQHFNTRERAKEIADAWSKSMRDSSRVSDFVSVGDVSIKVIGADSRMLDTEVPVRQMLEQIVAKLQIPPFLLGLSWSSTERMSSVQADILTSELEYYRTLVTPVIRKICDMQLRLMGETGDYKIRWSNINLLDEVELARARLINAQADKVKKALEVND